MGACNSSGARSFEQRCARKMRHREGKSKRRNSTSSSSSSSSSDGAAPEVGGQQKEKEKEKEKEKKKAPLSREQIVEEEQAGEEPTKAPKQQQQPQAKEPDEAERKRARLARLKEGVDFIETEEDAEAVESAVVKIQSTFRGKKIRSKLGGAASKTQASTSNAQSEQKEPQKEERSEEELNKKVATMQVNDNSGGSAEANRESAEQSQGSNLASANLPEEAERAATKIQAGFKGYKTRKELEGKLAGVAVNANSAQESEATQK